MELCRDSKAVPRIFLSIVAWTVVSAGDDKPQPNVTCMSENGDKQFRMKTFISPALIAALAIGLPLTRLTGHASTETAGSSEGFYAPETIEWKPGPPSLPAGAKMAVLEGDPTKEGPFVMRLQAPAGYHIAPHTRNDVVGDGRQSGSERGKNLDRWHVRVLACGDEA
jgi:hypothetical protein